MNHDYANPDDLQGPYLAGPLVIRVYPDGRPVPIDTNDNRKVVRDEDIEDFKIPLQSSKKFQQLFSDKSIDKITYNKLSQDLLPPKSAQSNLPKINNIHYYRQQPFNTLFYQPSKTNNLFMRLRRYF